MFETKKNVRIVNLYCLKNKYNSYKYEHPVYLSQSKPNNRLQLTAGTCGVFQISRFP